MDVIGLIDRVEYVEPIECFTSARIEDMNWLREVVAALFHQKFYHGESTTCKWWCHPNESRLENEGIAHGTIYVGIRICTKYSFFVKAHCNKGHGATSDDACARLHSQWHQALWH